MFLIKGQNDETCILQIPVQADVFKRRVLSEKQHKTQKYPVYCETEEKLEKSQAGDFA